MNADFKLLGEDMGILQSPELLSGLVAFSYNEGCKGFDSRSI